MTSSSSSLRNTNLFPLPCPILPSYVTMLILLKCHFFSILLLLSLFWVILWHYLGWIFLTDSGMAPQTQWIWPSFFPPIALSQLQAHSLSAERGSESEIHSSALSFNKRNLYAFRSLCPTLTLVWTLWHNFFKSAQGDYIQKYKTRLSTIDRWYTSNFTRITKIPTKTWWNRQ